MQPLLTLNIQDSFAAVQNLRRPMQIGSEQQQQQQQMMLDVPDLDIPDASELDKSKVICQVMQQCSTDLHFLLKHPHLRSSYLPLEDRIGIVAQLTKTVIQLSEFQIVHGDIKPQNMLLNVSTHAKISLQKFTPCKKQAKHMLPTHFLKYCKLLNLSSLFSQILRSGDQNLLELQLSDFNLAVRPGELKTRREGSPYYNGSTPTQELTEKFPVLPKMTTASCIQDAFPLLVILAQLLGGHEAATVLVRSKTPGHCDILHVVATLGTGWGLFESQVLTAMYAWDRRPTWKSDPAPAVNALLQAIADAVAVCGLVHEAQVADVYLVTGDAAYATEMHRLEEQCQQRLQSMLDKFKIILGARKPKYLALLDGTLAGKPSLHYINCHSKTCAHVR